MRHVLVTTHLSILCYIIHNVKKNNLIICFSWHYLSLTFRVATSLEGLRSWSFIASDISMTINRWRICKTWNYYSIYCALLSEWKHKQAIEKRVVGNHFQFSWIQEIKLTEIIFQFQEKHYGKQRLIETIFGICIFDSKENTWKWKYGFPEILWLGNGDLKSFLSIFLLYNNWTVWMEVFILYVLWVTSHDLSGWVVDPIAETKYTLFCIKREYSQKM